MKPRKKLTPEGEAARAKVRKIAAEAAARHRAKEKPWLNDAAALVKRQREEGPPVAMQTDLLDQDDEP